MYDEQFFLRINKEEKPQAEALAQAIIETLAPKSIVDVGCATGLYLKPLLDRGVSVRGIDKSLVAWDLAVIPQDLIWVMDITGEFPGVDKWDVALCLELLEHIEEAGADAALDNLTSFADTIVFSAALPGQGGEGHVNCQPKDYWLDEFALRGYRLNQGATERILQRVAELCSQRMGWLDINLMVLEKKKMELHFISTAEHFPYPYYLAVISALKVHDVSKVNLWCTVLPTSKYFQALRDKVNIIEVSTPAFSALKGKDAKFVAAHTKDYLQWKILEEHGGLYMDLDTLSLRDLTSLLGDKEVLAPLTQPDIDTCMFSFESAIVAAVPHSPIIQSIFRFVEGRLWEYTVGWGDTTPLIFSTIVREHLDKVVVLPQVVCHPFQGGEILYEHIELPPETRAIHLFASHLDAFNEVDEDFVEHGNTLYARTVRALLSKEERHPTARIDIDQWATAWGSRYRVLFETLASGTFHNILEIGTHKGENALHLIASAAQCVPEKDIHYFGFDLFEQAPSEELSLNDHYSLESVQEKLAGTDAAIRLFKGNTRETLRAADLPQMDFIFVDGGHSIDTIRSDWNCIQHLMGPNAVVFFDDYYEEMPFIGCKFLEDEISRTVYDVEVLPQKDVFSQPWGHLQVQLLCVSKKGASVDDITVTITSCGRFDLLERTVDSLLATFGRPVKVIISDDSENEEQHRLIREAYGNRDEFEVCIADRNHGQAWNLDFLYGKVDTKYIFHCEDDWEFLQSGYIEKSLDILEGCPDVVVVGLVKDARFEQAGAVGQRHETEAGTVYYDQPLWRIDENHAWWHGWVGSPHLLRKADYLALGRFSDHETEYEYDCRFGTSGKQSVWLEDKYVEHTGYGRSTFEPDSPHRWVPVSQSIPNISQHHPTFRFHMLGLAHVPTSREFMPCAYSQKIVKLCTMLKDLGHTVYFYGGEGSDLDCDEMVQVVSNQDRIDCYGDYDWKTEFFKLSGTDSCHTTFNENAIEEINARKQDSDLVLCPMGWWHKPITDAVGLAAIESGIGYSGVFAKYRVFESYAWMHHVYGLTQQNDGSWYDAVIPNYFDPADFPYQEEKDDYFLYIGRLVKRKGIEIAIQATEKIGAKLIIAGQGSLVNASEGLNITSPHVEHVGTVGPERRAELMGHARAVFVPTMYIEPFGGVAVEAMMCGAPVITSDWGAMSETVLPQITGYRCRTFGEFVWAAENVDRIRPIDCREWAINNYSMDRVKWQYQAFFEQVKDLWGPGWYDMRHRGISEYRRFFREF